MTTFQAPALGIMEVWTPSLLWRVPVAERESEQLSAQELSADHVDRSRLLRSTKAGAPKLEVEDTAPQPKGDEQVIVATQDAPRVSHEA
jgi:hypothetical protein